MMNLRKTYWAFPIAAAAMFLAAAFSATNCQAQTEFRWKLAPGQVFHHTLSQESTTSVMLPGQAIESTSTLLVDNTWTVNKVDSQGNATISQTTTRVRMKIESPMGAIDVDTSSNTPPADSIGKQLAKSLGTLTKSKITFVMSPLGEVSNVEVTTPEGAGPSGGDPLTEMLGKDGIASMVKQTMQLVPKEPVSKGLTWKNKMEVKLPLLGKVITDSTLTYDGQVQSEGKTLEQIKVTTTTSLAEKPGANQPLQIAIKDQTETGSVYFDNKAGRFSHSEANQTMKLQVTIAGQPIDQTVKTVRKAVLSPATAP